MKAPRYRQIGTLDYDEQERAIAVLRARGALPSGDPPVPPRPCGHRPDDVVLDLDGVECCGGCWDDSGEPLPLGPPRAPPPARLRP